LRGDDGICIFAQPLILGFGVRKPSLQVQNFSVQLEVVLKAFHQQSAGLHDLRLQFRVPHVLSQFVRLPQRIQHRD